MKRAILISILFLGIGQLFGQNLQDTIEIYNFSGTEYYLNDKKLHARDLQEITLTDVTALNEILAARRNNNTATILAISGGFLLGSHLFLRITQRGSIVAAGVIGTGLIVSSFPFFALYNKHAGRGVKIYNDGIKQKNLKNNEVSLGFTSSGIGIQMAF